MSSLGLRLKVLDDWVPDHPVRWAAAFALLYAAFFMLNVLLSNPLDILSDRISLVFFPAFIRVVAVVVAGLAGAAGIVIGSAVIQIFYENTAFWPASLLSLSSGIGVFAAYAAMRMALGGKRLPITLPVLLALTCAYSVFNAVIHGFIWPLIELGDSINIRKISLMMLGDLLGVIAMFAACRVLLRTWRLKTA